jgi:hypothetical protein
MTSLVTCVVVVVFVFCLEKIPPMLEMDRIDLMNNAAIDFKLTVNANAIHGQARSLNPDYI